jgi:excisionase family DNA binding protein
MYKDIKWLMAYLPDKPSIHTVYKWTERKKIPFTKLGKKLFFIKKNIDEWNAKGRPANG